MQSLQTRDILEHAAVRFNGMHACRYATNRNNVANALYVLTIGINNFGVVNPHSNRTHNVRVNRSGVHWHVNRPRVTSGSS